jgi:hypothetical protein
MSRLIGTHAAALCLIAGGALAAAGHSGGPSNAERKRIRERQHIAPPVEVAGDNLPGETNRQFAARMKAARDEQGQSE